MKGGCLVYHRINHDIGASNRRFKDACNVGVKVYARSADADGACLVSEAKITDVNVMLPVVRFSPADVPIRMLLPPVV